MIKQLVGLVILLTFFATNVAYSQVLPFGRGVVTGEGGGTDDQIALEVPFTPEGSIAATNVQTAIQEVRDEAVAGADTDDQVASEVPFTPTGTIAATDTQTAVAEVASESATNLATHESDTTSIHGIPDTSVLVTQTTLDAHVGDVSEAHPASAVGVLPFGTIAATDVQGALEEIVAETTGGTDDQTAAEVPVTPFGTIAATDVQAALEEIVTESTGGTDDQTATEVPFTPTGTIAGTDTQTAVAEVATDAASNLATHEADTTSIHGIADTSALVTQTTLNAHIDDTADAHDASAISYAGGTGIAATDVEGAVDELATEKANTADAVMDGDTAGGVLAGTYPDPSFASDMATQAELDAHSSDTTSVHGITDTSTLALTTDTRFPTADEKAGLAANSPTAANPVITQNELTVSAGTVTSDSRPPDSGDACILEDRWRDTSVSPAVWYLPADCTLDAEVWTATTSEAPRNVPGGLPEIDEGTLRTPIQFAAAPRAIVGEPSTGACQGEQDIIVDISGHQVHFCEGVNTNPFNPNLFAPYFKTFCDTAGACIHATPTEKTFVIEGTLNPTTRTLTIAADAAIPGLGEAFNQPGGNIIDDAGPTKPVIIRGDGTSTAQISMSVDGGDTFIKSEQLNGTQNDPATFIPQGGAFSIVTDTLEYELITEDEPEVLKLLERASDSATCPTGQWCLYAKSTGLFVKDDAGVVTGPLGTGGGGGATSKHFRPFEILADGTNCKAGTGRLNTTGPLTDYIFCADSNSSIIEGNFAISDIGGCPASTLNFTLKVYHATTEAITFAGDFSAMYRRFASADVVDATWSGVDANSDADVAIATAHQIEQATASVTPNGTCDDTAMVFWRYVVDATNFSTNALNSRILGVTIAQP